MRVFKELMGWKMEVNDWERSWYNVCRVRVREREIEREIERDLSSR